MATKKKMLQAAAGSAGGAGGLDVDEVFSTQLYSGSSANRNIVNGIDLDGHGGMIWTKARTANFNNVITDTEQGLSPYLVTNATSKPDNGGSDTVTSFNSDGYSLGVDGQWYWNKSGYNFVSWTWRKAPKFLDIVTWTGGGETSLTLDHDLGCAVGWLVVKRLDAAESWYTWFRAGGMGNGYIRLDATAAKSTYTGLWANTAPTSTQFTVADDFTRSGRQYVAYLFAHNDGDGEFGPDSDQDIIKCGSYTGNGSTGVTIDLGFEPQWLLIKRTNAAQNWNIYDNMRGLTAGPDSPSLSPNIANAEGGGNEITVLPNGFAIFDGNDNVGGSGSTYIYMAIRRGSLAPPTDATKVFSVYQNQSTATTPFAVHGFAPDFAFYKSAGTTEDFWTGARLIQEKSLRLNTTNAEGTAASHDFDYMNGWATISSTQTDYHSFAWKRAPSFCDVVCWKTENTANRRLKHNLGVPPEMAWVKLRTSPPYASSGHWYVYHTGLANKYMYLNSNDDVFTSDLFTAPHSATEFGIAENSVWSAGSSMIGFFFATLAGISKVGSVTHSGTTNVDCGFASGSRFVLLKRTDANGSWFIWDSVRGIVSGNDPYLRFDTGAAQVTSSDYIDPLSSGFTITSNFTAGDYIFYAIA